jgi:hypothetical protein
MRYIQTAMRRRQLIGTLAALSAALAWPSSRAVLAQSSLSAGMQASVTTDGLNVRGGPDASQPVVGTLDSGSLVDLLGASRDAAWWRIASASVVGYVNADYLEATGQSSTSAVFDLDLPIPYARQLSPVWCDPADVEMWMAYRQGGSTGQSSHTLQSAIWDWELAHNAGFSVDQWDCSPFAVASAAQNWMPDAGFDHFQYADSLNGSRVLAWLLSNSAYREPSIALIWRGLHYVLVRGVRAIGNPGADPAGAELLGFYVSDPYPEASFWLGADRFIPIERWLDELFVPISYQVPHTGVPGDVWQNRAVSIQRAPSATAPTRAGRLNATVSSYA